MPNNCFPEINVGKNNFDALGFTYKTQCEECYLVVLNHNCTVHEEALSFLSNLKLKEELKQKEKEAKDKITKQEER